MSSFEIPVGDEQENNGPTNDQRAQRALQILQAYVDLCGGVVSIEDAMVDLVTDLAHACDLKGLDWDKIGGLAYEHYEEETHNARIAAMNPVEFAELVASGNTNAERLEEIAKAVVQRAREVNHG